MREKGSREFDPLALPRDGEVVEGGNCGAAPKQQSLYGEGSHSLPR
jgi:hypothetical protein